MFTCSDGDPPPKTAINGNAWLNDIEVTEERVRELIDGMKENSAPGPDGFPPVLLKTLRDEIARPIAILFKKSLDDGQIPDEWREAEITPIHKKKQSRSRKLSGGESHKCGREDDGKNGEERD